MGHPPREGDLIVELWHRAFVRWYDHRAAGHRLRAALRGGTADTLVRLTAQVARTVR